MAEIMGKFSLYYCFIVLEGDEEETFFSFQSKMVSLNRFFKVKIN
jgi:hypothetical protein